MLLNSLPLTRVCTVGLICRGVLVLLGQREAVLPDPDQLPVSQQPDGGGLHAVHSGQPHAEREGGR